MDTAVVQATEHGPGVRLAAAPMQATNTLPATEPLPHILLALDGIAATLGGGERVVFKLARLLPSRGYRVSILTLSLDPQSPVLADPPCPIYLLPLQRTWDLKAVRSAAALRRFLVAQKIDLVQTFFESSDLWVGSVAKTVPGVRLVWSRRDMGILRERKHQVAYRLLRHMPDRVLAVSDEVRRHGIEIDGIPPERVETLYNGIDIPEVRSAPAHASTAANGDAPVIVSVGNVRPVKGFDVLLEAAIAVLREFPRATFQIAGQVLDAAYHARMVARAKEAGVADRFTFLGNVADVRSLLLTAGIFVLPSRSEGFSNAIVEAMACSLPVVATRVGGNGEAVLDGETGLIVAPEDAGSLASALLELARDPERARHMGESGRERALQCFTTDAMVSHHLRVYNSLRNTS